MWEWKNMQTLIIAHTLKWALSVPPHLAELSSFHLLNHLAKGVTRSHWYLGNKPNLYSCNSCTLYIWDSAHLFEFTLVWAAPYYIKERECFIKPRSLDIKTIGSFFAVSHCVISPVSKAKGYIMHYFKCVSSGATMRPLWLFCLLPGKMLTANKQTAD